MKKGLFLVFGLLVVFIVTFSVSAKYPKNEKSNLVLLIEEKPEKFIEEINKKLELGLSDKDKEKISVIIKDKYYDKSQKNIDLDDFIIELGNAGISEVYFGEIEKIENRFKEESKRNLENDTIGNGQIESCMDSTAKANIGWEDTSKFLGGSTYVSLFFVNENGKDWNVDYIEDRNYIIAELQKVKDWATSLAPGSAKVSFVKAPGYRVKNINTPSSEEGIIWMNEAVENIGVSFKTVNEMLVYDKNYLNVNNSVVIFVSHAPGRSYAYVSAPNKAISLFFYQNCEDSICSKTNYPIIAHELFHLFGAADEYSGSCGANSCWEPYIYSYPLFQQFYTNGNCEVCNPQSIGCVMKDHTIIETKADAICEHTKGQIGWGDYDFDSIVDPYDNCINESNSDQKDSNNDGFGDACTFCTPNLKNTSWTNWTNISCLKNDKMNQTRSRVQYDSNNCGNYTNKTIPEYRANQTCNNCSEDIKGPFYTNYSTCSIKDSKYRTKYFIDYNYNSCCLITNISSDCGIRNITYINQTDNQTCDYCQPNPVNTTLTGWKNQTSCLVGNYYIQNRSKTEYDSNYSSCYAITHNSTDLWNNGQNKTHWEFQNQTCDYCNYTPAFTNWTEWQNQTECSKDVIIQNRSRIEYDSNYNSCYAITHNSTDLWNNGENKTIWELQNLSYDCCNPKLIQINTTCDITDNFTSWYNDSNKCYEQTGLESDMVPVNLTNTCNYCSHDISKPFNTSWSECSDSFTKNRTIYYIDYNYSKCCAVTGLDSDCEINSKYVNSTETGSCNLSIDSTLRGVYNKSSVPFGVSSKENMIKLDYTENGKSWITLCKNCKSYNKSRSFGDERHNLTLRANFSNGIELLNVSFLVDSTDPRISTTEPRRNSFTNGSDFYIKFKEDNPKNLSITFNPTISLDLDNCVEDGSYQECYYDLNLSSYDNQTIEYYFTIEDLAGNKDESRPTKVNVDTTPPVVNNAPSYTYILGSRYVYFNMSITEKNFDEVVYTYLDSRGRLKETRLCSNLNNGWCYKKKSFTRGTYNLTISVLDDAGNSYKEEIKNLVIDY